MIGSLRGIQFAATANRKSDPEDIHSRPAKRPVVCPNHKAIVKKKQIVAQTNIAPPITGASHAY